MDAESFLFLGGLWRLEVAVELALPDAVDFRWTRLQTCYRRHCFPLLCLGQGHRADAPWSRFPSM